MSDGWTRLDDGMQDPRLGGEELTRRRQEAFRACLNLMGCNHPRGVNCDHVDALRGMGEAVTETANYVLVAAIHSLPRPLSMEAIVKLATSVRTVVLLPAENPEERRRP